MLLLPTIAAPVKLRCVARFIVRTTIKHIPAQGDNTLIQFSGAKSDRHFVVPPHRDDLRECCATKTRSLQAKQRNLIARRTGNKIVRYSYYFGAMKSLQILSVILLSFFLFACTSKRHLDYDAIDYYRNDSISDEDGYSEEQWKHATSFDSLKQMVVFGYTPQTPTDTGFILHMKAMGYRIRTVPSSNFKEIDRVLSNNPLATDGITTSCIAVYRNILVFRKRGKVVGTLKICFSCFINEPSGMPQPHKAFSMEEYSKLNELLYKL